jgi:hypothetical protein
MLARAVAALAEHSMANQEAKALTAQPIPATHVRTRVVMPSRTTNRRDQWSK